MPCRLPAQGLLPLFGRQLAGGGAPARALAVAFLLLAGLGPAMWGMWVHVGAANANFYYAITLLHAAWQARTLAYIQSAQMPRHYLL